jgi:hypothetical protein
MMQKRFEGGRDKLFEQGLRLRKRVLGAAYVERQFTLPGFEATTWHGVMVPAGTPGAVVAKLHRDIVAVLRMPDVAERLSSQGAEAIGSTPQAFASYVKTETAKWAKVVRESGAKAECGRRVSFWDNPMKPYWS